MEILSDITLFYTHEHTNNKCLNKLRATMKIMVEIDTCQTQVCSWQLLWSHHTWFITIKIITTTLEVHHCWKNYMFLHNQHTQHVYYSIESTKLRTKDYQTHLPACLFRLNFSSKQFIILNLFYKPTSS